MFFSSPVVEFLERELTYFKAQFQHERERAERAIDELLRVRVQVGPVAPPPPEPELAKEIKELLDNPEFSRVGETEG